MKGFLTTHRGMEDIAALDVKELIGKNSISNDSCVVFGIKEYEDLFRLCYKSQSAIGVYYYLCEFDFNKIDSFFDDFNKNLGNIDFTGWISKETTFRVKCRKNSEIDISTPEIEKKLGELIINHIQEKHDYKQKVDLNNPDIIIFANLTGKKCLIGVDFSGFDLSKRSYNIFMHSAAVKGTIAYCLVRLSGYNNKTLIDPFSGSGTIPIEAAFYASGFPMNFFNRERFLFLKFNKFRDYDFKKFFGKIDDEIKEDKLNIYNVDASMKNLNFAKKNSKIAGIAKKINFSRMDAEWLDTKFEKGAVDKIATKIPLLQGIDFEKLYNEFFYQAEFILSKNGKIALIGKKELVKKYSSKHKFKILSERSVFSGKKEHDVFVLGKK
ncbi:MAG: THUMP domain-containing protein [Candidatus Woesearchaeota archaeon]|jgi:23S rRNA G2445 N2-methylase RlmL|nr:THUMP domain-containing protein [Candidatus Woesearchaeota archaeon]|tara:strand:+ start:13465 stop:14607 length:1143 start_codon:yes stop_codon:yes gene_type:complete